MADSSRDKFLTLGKDTSVYGVGGALTGAVGILLLPVYTRMFSTADYGVMDVIATMTALAAIILASGSEAARSFYYFELPGRAERRKTVTTTAVYLFGVNSLVAALVFWRAEWICDITFGDKNHAPFLRVAIASIPFTCLTRMNLNVLRLQRKPWSFVALNFPQVLLSLLLNIYFVAILKIGIIGVFWTNLIVSVLFALIGLVVNRAYIGRAFDLRRLGQLLRYGSPLLVAGVATWSINYLNRYFLLHYAAEDQVGLYAVGMKVAFGITFVTAAFRTANAPFQLEMASGDDARKIYGRTLTYYMLVTSLLCVAVSLFARPLLRLLATDSYMDAYKVVPFLAFSIVADGVCQLVAIGLLLTKKTGTAGLMTAIAAILNVLYLLILVPLWGMAGAALATLLAYATVVLLLFRPAQRAYPIPYDLNHVSRILLGAGAVIVAGRWIDPRTLQSELLVGAGLLALFLFMIPALSLVAKRDRREVAHTIQMFLNKLRKGRGD